MSFSTDTLSQRVHAELRRRILNAELVRGERVNLERLSKELHVSPSPLKNALRQLAREGLVEIRPRSGTVVRNFDGKDVADIYRCRDLIEPAAAAIVAAAGPAPAALIETLDDAIRTLVDASDGEQFIRPLKVSDADGAFHRLIVKATGNTVLAELHDILITRALMVRSYASGGPRAVETIAEHRAILLALAAGDPAAAEEASRLHLRGAERFTLSSMGNDRVDPSQETGTTTTRRRNP